MTKKPEPGQIYTNGEQRIQVLYLTRARVAVRDLATGMVSHLLMGRFAEDGPWKLEQEASHGRYKVQ